jgi:hypothetical protein
MLERFDRALEQSDEADACWERFVSKARSTALVLEMGKAFGDPLKKSDEERRKIVASTTPPESKSRLRSAIDIEISASEQLSSKKFLQELSKAAEMLAKQQIKLMEIEKNFHHSFSILASYEISERYKAGVWDTVFRKSSLRQD